MTVLAWVAFGLAALPLGMLVLNLCLYRRLGPASPGGRPKVSLLVPARNEAERIDAALDAALAQRDVDLDLVVLDDDSEDDTARRVEARAAVDGRVRLARAPKLPPGWCGKQHACLAAAREARHDLLVFVDADVRLAPDALSRIAAFFDAHPDVALASGFPREEAGSFLERLLIPLIHFVLLGFLPLARMRRSTSPAYAAGCGQLMAARRDAYERVGGHGAIRASRHDGITLPRAFRRAGLATDLFDATDVATCRMYASGAEVWNGLAKNATEGMASPRAILPWSLLLLGGHVLPWILLVAALAFPGGAAGAPWLLPAALGAGAGLVARLLLAFRFRQPLDGALLHPLGVLLLVAVQFFALAREAAGRRVAWKGRTA